MNYLAKLAEEIRQEVSSDLLPEQDPDLLFLIYAVLARAKGVQVETTDVHDAWTAWMTYQRGEHPSMREFTELPARVQVQDLPFLRAIHRVAERRAVG
jgi:hypothetical protein